MHRFIATSCLLALSVPAQAVIGGYRPAGPPAPATYTFNGTSVPQRFFQDLGEILEPYQALSTPTGSASLPKTMSQQFAAAATTASSFEQAIVSGIGQVGTPRLAAGIATDIDTLEQGFAAIASDLADGSLELAHGPGVCAVALFELANSIPQVDPVLIACQQPLLDASQAMVTMSTIADPNLTEAEAQVIYETMFEFYQNMQLVAESLMPAFDAAIPASAPTATSSGLCPPSHPFKGCTTYQKTTYVPPPFCGGWVHLAGGISVPGITILPDSGLWVRTCWWVTQTTIKEVCECYGSRWDRLWAIGGTNKVITTSPHPTFGTDSTTDYDITGLTAPSSSAPGTPSPDVKVL